MRLWLVRRLRLLRRPGSIPFAKHALAECASSSDVNRRLFSSVGAAWLPPAVQKKRSCLGANGIGPVCAAGGRLLLKPSYNPTLEFLRRFADGYRGPRPPAGKEVVAVSSEVWQLLREYEVPEKLMSIYRVHIEAAQTSSKGVQLTIRGRKAREVATMLADPPRKLDVPEEVGLWLITEGPNGLRVKDILNRSGALAKPSHDNKSVLLGGSSKAILAAKRIIEFDIDDFVGFYLINNRGCHQKRLNVETDALISAEPVDGARKWKAVVVGPTESVKRLRRKLDGLHVERLQKPQAVCQWLTNPGKGTGEDARSLVLDRKYNTYIHTGPLTDSDPARLVDLVIVGERENNVDDVLAVFGHIVVEKVNITKLQEEFWMGHEDEENRNRLHHRLEGATDTCLVCDSGAGCFHVSGRTDNVREVMKEINKTQHIALRTSVVSFAMANYIGRWARRAYENDGCQIHLAKKDMRPGAWELRRLHVVASQGDDAEVDKADEDLMRKLDLDEVVLEVPTWTHFLLSQCREIEKDTTTGINFSEDAINRRVIVDIAGSRSTVKQGMKEVIRRIESHTSYKEGDICLRRIEGESVDTAGFKKIGDAKPLDSSRCKEPFAWGRLTPERWCYAGAPRGGRPPKRPRQPSV